MTNSRAPRQWHRLRSTSAILASDILTPLSSHVIMDTEASGATDDCHTITLPGLSSYNILMLIRSTSSSRDPTLKDEGAGALHIAGDFTLTSTHDHILLFIGVGPTIYEVSRSDNT